MNEPTIKLVLEKKALENILHIWARPEIENFFKAAAQNGASAYDDGGDSVDDESITAVSAKWTDENGQGIEYYRKNEKLSNKVQGYGAGAVLDNFGNGLIDGSRVNLALLRAVGISRKGTNPQDIGGVTFKTSDLIGFEDMKQYINGLGTWAKKFYEENLKERVIKGDITFEA